jgi:FixJ family two-component response regulator
MNGHELAKKLTASRPEARVLFMSGYTSDAIMDQGILDPSVAFLQKPFTTSSLARKVREVLDGERSKTAVAGK